MGKGFIGNVALPGQSNSPLPSPALWGRVKPNLLEFNDGQIFFDTFKNFDGSVASNVGRYTSNGGWRSFEDTGGTILNIATNHRGVIRFTTPATDNLECNLVAGSPTSVMYRISDGAGERDVVIYEARIAVGSIADTVAGVFVGLTEEGTAVTDGIITDAGALADKDLIGFWRLEGDGDQIDVVHKKAGQTAVTVLADALATANNSPITALTAGEFVKLGFVYDFKHPDGPRIEYFVNGQKLNTALSLANGVFAATFPDAEELTPAFCIKNAAAAAATLDVDWVGGYQELLA